MNLVKQQRKSGRKWWWIAAGVLVLTLLAASQIPNVKVESIAHELDRLEALFPQRDGLDTSVSKVDVAWHLDHSLKTFNRIYESLEAADPEVYQWRPNPTRTFVFSSGSMPRGRGKAPDAILPPDVITDEALVEQLALARDYLSRLDSLPEKAHFSHPVFGQLDREGAKQFLLIHTRHHLAIVNDILGSSQQE